MENRLSQASPEDSMLTARIRSYELAARMQLSVPEVTRLDEESADTRKRYGLDDPACAAFGRNCLLTRRLLERGVRFVQLYHDGAFGSPRVNWDGHEDVRQNHLTQATNKKQPDTKQQNNLAQRGMLDDTLV